MAVKKVYIIGPESTGKSTLCRQLSQHLGMPWCPEYARDYLAPKGGAYHYEDLEEIAKGQLRLENDYLHELEKNGRDGMLIIDTDMHVLRIWAEFVFGKCPHFILDHLCQQRSDLYLLCNTDVAWEPDPLREQPDLHIRQSLFHMYKAMMEDQPIPFTIIRGADYSERLRQAMEAVALICPVIK